MSKSLLMGLLLSLYFCLGSLPLYADDNVDGEIKALKEQMQTMQNKINQLEEKDSVNAKSVPTVPIPNRGAAPKWLPEIGVVADIVGTLDSAKTDEGGSDRVSLRELELVLGSAIDPFSRLDATISFSDTENPSLEEAYMTRFGLPFDTTARLGKFKPKVGKVIGVHRDSLDTVDEPLVIQKYFGAEGMNKSGLDFSTTLKLPLPITQQLSFGVLEGGNGEGGTAFGDDIHRRPTFYSHLKNYVDINDTTGFELGLSHMIGSRDEDASFEVQVLGLDTTLTHNFNATQNMKIQSEVFNLNRKESFVNVDEDDGFGGTITVPHSVDGNLWGTYSLVDLRVAPQWATGFRYDYVQLVDNLDNPNKADMGYTGYLTFYQSELARWRMQVTHKDLATGKDDNAVYLQGTFAIGEHKHKLQ